MNTSRQQTVTTTKTSVAKKVSVGVIILAAVGALGLAVLGIILSTSQS